MQAGGDILERAEQLAFLDALWLEVIGSGRGRMVLVRGEAGSGKTTLVGAFSSRAAGRPFAYWGACDRLGTTRPLGPFLDLAAELRSGQQPPSELRPDVVATEILADLSGRPPAIIVLEDLHWADEASIDALRILARRIRSTPVLILATYRDDEIDHAHPLRLLLGEIPGTLARVNTPPFSQALTEKLAAEANMDGEIVYQKTSGNPFFVTEVIASGTEAVPETVRDAVIAKVSRLPAYTRRVLEAVAIASPPIEAWLLAQMVEDPDSGVEAALGAGLLRAAGGVVTFRHELARLAVLDLVTPTRALELHRRALSALGDPPTGPPDVSRLARHAEGAQDGEAIRKYTATAASQAADLGMHHEAAELYGRVLRIGDRIQPLDSADLYKRHARSCHLVDRGADAIASGYRAVEIYHELGDVLAEAEMLSQLSKYQRMYGEIRGAVQSTERAFTLLGGSLPSKQLALAYANAAQAKMCVGDLAEAVEAGEKAIGLAETVGDQEAVVHALITIATAEMEYQGTWDRGRQRMDRAIGLAKLSGLTDLVGRAYNNLAYELVTARQLANAGNAVAEALDYHKATGDDLWLLIAISAQAQLHLFRGEWDAAGDLAQQVLSRSDSPFRVDSLLVVGLLRARRGDPDPWGPLDEALGLARQAAELQYIVVVSAARAEAAWLENNNALAVSETDELVEQAVTSGYGWALDSMAYWRWQVGVREEAVEFDTSPRRLHMSGRALEAFDQWERSGYPYEAALALLDTGDEKHMLEALERFRSLGARAAAEITVRRLRAMGARHIPRGPNRVASNNPAGLTARELEVLRLVVEGLTDGEIAERLYLSRRTVSQHVSTILRKLDAKSRRHVKAEAQRLGLLDA